MQSFKSKQLNSIPKALRDEVLGCRSIKELNAYTSNIQMQNQTMELNADNQVNRITLSVGHLDLLSPVDSKSLEGGNVEQFLETLEAQVQTSLKALMKTAIPKINVDKIDTVDSSFTDLPLQVFTTAYFVGLTSQITKAMNEGKLEGAVNHFKSLEVSLIRLVHDNWPQPLRTRLNTLITVVVAFSELAQRLLNAGDMTEECVELWKDTPRWVFDGEKVQVKTYQTSRFQGSAVLDYIDYGYHLLDFQELLVHTVLTWKVYSGIVSCNVGVMGLGGPAGTGKTESVKDFANLCGIKLIVYSASDLTSKEDLDNLYDCCDATHSVCIDEFNRCTPQVIFNETGKLMTSAKETENKNQRITGVPNFRFFVTMNPKYIGRSQISDDSKFPLEWVVLLSVPDVCDILHIKLATQGYQDAKTLGFKFAACLKNLRETAMKDKKNHLDFGLRAALSICKAAGIIHRADMTLDESLALSIALYKVIGCKYPVDDREALAAYITTTFIGPDQQSVAIVQNYTTCRQVNIINSPWLTFWETKELRHGVMLLTSQDTFQFANSLANWLNKLKVQKCSAFAMSQGTPDEMRGSKNHPGPGVYEQFMKKAAEEKKIQHYLIIAGAPAENVYGYNQHEMTFEPLNQVLDDNKILHLWNDVRVPMPPNARIVFVAWHKVANNMSPAVVSRLGFVYY